MCERQRVKKKYIESLCIWMCAKSEMRSLISLKLFFSWAERKMNLYTHDHSDTITKSECLYVFDSDKRHKRIDEKKERKSERNVTHSLFWCLCFKYRSIEFILFFFFNWHTKLTLRSFRCWNMYDVCSAHHLFGLIQYVCLFSHWQIKQQRNQIQRLHSKDCMTKNIAYSAHIHKHTVHNFQANGCHRHPFDSWMHDCTRSSVRLNSVYSTVYINMESNVDENVRSTVWRKKMYSFVKNDSNTHRSKIFVVVSQRSKQLTEWMRHGCFSHLSVF